MNVRIELARSAGKWEVRGEGTIQNQICEYQLNRCHSCSIKQGKSKKEKGKRKNPACGRAGKKPASRRQGKSFE